mmetsp:Transcript_98432/g.263132  ORF Transcript_98432/g.263132 Transcript_98432/m.263132 type:complete len:232 (-) Transcript_98432:1692-2387(-)
MSLHFHTSQHTPSGSAVWSSSFLASMAVAFQMAQMCSEHFAASQQVSASAPLVASCPSFVLCPTGHVNAAQDSGSTTACRFNVHAPSVASKRPPAAFNWVSRAASASAFVRSERALCPSWALVKSAKYTLNSAVWVNTPPWPFSRRAAAAIFSSLATVTVTSTVLTERSAASISWTALWACSVVAWATKVAAPVTGTGVTAGSSSQHKAAGFESNSLSASEVFALDPTAHM